MTSKKFIVVPGLGVVAADPEERHQLKNGCPMIMNDIKPFKSPVDGSVVLGRAGLRRHNEKHGVVDMREFTESGHWDQKRKEREKHFTTGELGKQDRIEAIKHAIDVNTHK